MVSSVVMEMSGAVDVFGVFHVSLLRVRGWFGEVLSSKDASGLLCRVLT